MNYKKRLNVSDLDEVLEEWAELPANRHALAVLAIAAAAPSLKPLAALVKHSTTDRQGVVEILERAAGRLKGGEEQ